MKNQKAILAAVFTMVFSLGAVPLRADVLFDDGGVHNVGWQINGNVIIKNDAFFNNPTIVNFIQGGRLYSYDKCYIYGSSLLNVDGCPRLFHGGGLGGFS